MRKFRAVGRLLAAAEVVAFYLAVGPVLGLLPAPVAYGVARWRGDLMFRTWAGKRAEVLCGLRLVLGDELDPAEIQRVARDVFRIRSCEIIDLMRLRGRARALGRLVDIRGREHLEAALAQGKGAIFCSAHFGSYLAVHSLLQEAGFPVTTMGRWWWRYPPGQATVSGRVWDFIYARRVLRHRQRPNIEPWPGRVQTAVQAAAVLRDNEVVTIASDAPPLAAEANRALSVPFLGRQATMLPGVVPLAQLTGAPVLMVTAYRTADYRHQVLEISPPVPMGGGTAVAFERCTTVMETAIRQHPAEWDFWFEPGDLVRLGLIPDATLPAARPGPVGSAAAGPGAVPA